MESCPIALPELIRRGAKNTPHRILIEEVGGRQQTYGELYRDSLRWATAFEQIGVKAGDVVATIIPPVLDSYHCWQGLAWLRSIESAINNEYQDALLSRAINGCKAELLVVGGRFFPQIAAISDRLDHIRKVVVIGDFEARPGLPFETIPAADFIARSEPVERPDPGHWDCAGIIYTSGSTGVSKGVIVTWAMIGHAAAATFPDDDPADYEDGAYYSPWQQYHLTGKTALDISVRLGLRLVLRDKFSVSGLWEDVRAYRCTHFLLAFIAPWLWREPARADDADNPLRRISMVPLIPEWREFGERFGVRITSQWASTEAAFPMTVANPPNHRTAGIPCSGYEVRIVDEHDIEVPDGQAGELLIRHAQPWRITPGYLGDPEASAEVWRNGWLHTGDSFVKEADGYYYFVDRLKDYIKYRGKSVSAFEIEREVALHDRVVECSVVGVKSDLSSADVLGGEDIRVFVVAENGSDLTPSELCHFLTARLPKFMLPRYFDFIPALPRNHVNKVAKPSLRNMPLGADTWDREGAAKSTP